MRFPERAGAKLRNEKRASSFVQSLAFPFLTSMLLTGFLAPAAAGTKVDEYIWKGYEKRDAKTGLLRARYNIRTPPRSGSEVDIARDYLNSITGELGIPADMKGFRAEVDRVDGESKHVRFVQESGGVPVYGARVQVNLTGTNSIKNLKSTYLENVHVPSTQPAISREEAEAIIQGLSKESIIFTQPTSLWIVRRDGDSSDHLVWLVRTLGGGQQDAERVFLDARTGDVVHRESDAVHFQDGVGTIFSPDPRTTFVE